MHGPSHGIYSRTSPNHRNPAAVDSFAPSILVVQLYLVKPRLHRRVCTFELSLIPWVNLTYTKLLSCAAPTVMKVNRKGMSSRNTRLIVKQLTGNQGLVPIVDEPGAPLTLVTYQREYGCYDSDTSTDLSADENWPPETPTLEPPTVLARRGKSQVVGLYVDKDTLSRQLAAKYEGMRSGARARMREWVTDESTFSDAKSSFIPPSPVDVLRHMLQKVEGRHFDRYGCYLRMHSQDDIMQRMEQSLCPQAWEVLCSGKYTRDKYASIQYNTS